jgi:hypothetical protein
MMEPDELRPALEASSPGWAVAETSSRANEERDLVGDAARDASYGIAENGSTSDSTAGGFSQIGNSQCAIDSHIWMGAEVTRPSLGG